MQIDIKKLDKSEIEITGEIQDGDFESFRQEALKNISKDIKIDGFRPGNIPEKILTDKVGEGTVLEEMANLSLRKFYQKIIDENNLKVIGRPEIVITKIARNNPLGFKIKTAVMPEIILPDYKKIAKETREIPEEIKVEEKEIDNTLEYLRKSRATKNEKGEMVLPELDDNFVKTFNKPEEGKNIFENISDLRKVIHENLINEKKIKTKEKKRIKILDKITESLKIEIPNILIESEKNKLLNEAKFNIEQMGLEWNKYLDHLKKTEEEILKEMESDAIRRVKYGLILDEIGIKEKINVSQQELEAENDKLAKFYKKSGHNLDREKIKSYVYGILSNEKIFKLLESC